MTAAPPRKEEMLIYTIAEKLGRFTSKSGYRHRWRRFRRISTAYRHFLCIAPEGNLAAAQATHAFFQEDERRLKEQQQ